MIDQPGQDPPRRRRLVVVVNDTIMRTRIVAQLQAFYNVRACTDLTSGLATCRQYRPDVALVGDDLEADAGFDFVRLVRIEPSLARMATLMLVTTDDPRTGQLVARCGAHAHVSMACPQSGLLHAITRLINRTVERSWTHLPALQRRALTGTIGAFNRIYDVIEGGEPIAYEAVREACEPLVQAIANNDVKEILRSVRDHDDYSYVHSLRVATLLGVFGHNLGLSHDEQLLLASGGLLHDVGKMVIPLEILNKPGRLTAAEFEVVKRHVDASVAYLQRDGDLPSGVLTIAAQHHEKLDGTGYPKGLSGHQLNELARMAAIADVFSALTDRRVYKPPMETEAALKLMTEEMVGHLDQALLRLFREMMLDSVRDTVT